MNIEINDKQVIPYSHHYRCFPQMVGSVVNQAVFMYLLDEYLCRLKTGRNTEFVVSANEIAQKRNMTWRTVTNSLNELQTMQLISMNDKVCVVNTNKYISLIKAFHALTKTTDKKQFIELLHSGDYANLQRFGYVERNDGNEQLLTQEGVMLNSRTLCKNTQPNENGLCQIAEGYAKKHNSDDEKLCKMTEPYAKKHNLMLNSRTLCQIAEPYAKKQKVLLKSISIFEDIRQKIQENYTKVDFIDEFRDEFLEFFSEEEFGNLVYAIFEENELKNVIFGPELLVFLCSGVLSFSRRGFCHLAEGVMLNSRTVNKEININKILTSEAGIYCGEEESKENIFELDKTSLEQSISGYQQVKRKQSLPFFPVNEVEEYISDIRNCLDRADKIYINQVWEIAHECFDQEAILDKDGYELLPADNNIENIGVKKERLMKDILLPAFDKTQEIVEVGIIVVNGEEHRVTAVIDNPDDFENIIDWELQTLLDGDDYIISKKRVRNIYAQVIESPSRSVSRGKREDDMTYMQKIILLGDDDTQYGKLSPMELVVYNFLNEYFQIGNNGEIEEPKLQFVNRTNLANFYLDAKDKGVTLDDFLSVLSKDKPEYGTGSLNLRQRMFSADKIRKWNRLHSIAASVVDTFEINA